MNGWLLLGLMVVLLSGCTSASEPSSGPASNPPAVKKSAPETQPREKPKLLPTAPSMKGIAKKGPDGSLVDEFNLPLTINLDAPEVPEEIRGPSKPIGP
jgi:hypothetical protein